MRFPIPSRVSAFTLVELVVVLVVSALLFRLAYLALGLVQRQQAAYEHHSGQLGQLSTWQRALDNDLRRAYRVTVSDDEVRCQLPAGPIVYAWRDSVLTRWQGEAADTLLAPVQASAYFWRGQPRNQGLLNEVNYLVVAAHDTFYLQATAHYTAQQLTDSLVTLTP